MRISFCIDDQLVGRLDRIAKSMKRSRSFVAAEAISRYVHYQDSYISSVVAAIAEADNGGPFVSHEEVVAMLDGPRDATT